MEEQTWGGFRVAGREVGASIMEKKMAAEEEACAAAVRGAEMEPIDVTIVIIDMRTLEVM